MELRITVITVADTGLLNWMHGRTAYCGQNEEPLSAWYSVPASKHLKMLDELLHCCSHKQQT